MSRSILISIIIPCHNEDGNVELLHQELTSVLERLPERFEFIFVNDGSRDTTAQNLARLAQRDHRVRIIELVRNFGKEIATTAGLHHARGAAAITIDADLQHPPSLIPELIRQWRGGAEVVIGVRGRGYHHSGLAKRLGTSLFYRLINLMTEVEIKAGATDYRLLDRAVIDEFNRLTEHHRLTRGLVDWLGFRRQYVEFIPAQRHAGTAAYSYIKLLGLAINSFVSMSLLPLRLSGLLGLIIMVTAGPLGLFILVEKYGLHDPWHFNFSGPAILAVLILFLVGIILVSLGLMALYIATIHTEVTNRPLYVLRREALDQPPVDPEVARPHRQPESEAQPAAVLKPPHPHQRHT